MVASLNSENMRYLILNDVPKRIGSVSRNLTPTQVFQCQEGSLSLAVANDGQFAKLMKVLGRPEVAEDPRFAKNRERGRNRDVLIPLLEELFRSRPAKEWVERIGAAAIPCGQVNDIKAVFAEAKAVGYHLPLVREVIRLRAMRAEAGDGFPEKVTAFRADMAVHGRYGQACPRCGDPVQRIVHADNEVNYCATCQVGGKVLADRSLSRLLKDEWPRTIEEWEGLRSR